MKHGGAYRRQPIDEVVIATEEGSVDLLALDEALAKLASEDERKAELVKLRHFAGLSIVEAAEVLSISKATADRWWSYARAYLFHEISKGDPGAED